MGHRGGIDRGQPAGGIQAQAKPNDGCEHDFDEISPG